MLFLFSLHLTLLPLTSVPVKLSPASLSALSGLLPLILDPLVCALPNFFHISVALHLLLSLLSIDCESVSGLFFRLLKCQPRFLRVVPLFESFLKKDIISEHTDSVFIRNPHQRAWLDNHLSPEEVIWRRTNGVDSQSVLRLVLGIIQKLCHGVNCLFQNFFRHQNTSRPLTPDSAQRLRVVEEFNPNNPDSIDFIRLFCDFTFSSALMFCRKVLGGLTRNQPEGALSAHGGLLAVQQPPVQALRLPRKGLPRPRHVLRDPLPPGQRPQPQQPRHPRRPLQAASARPQRA